MWDLIINPRRDEGDLAADNTKRMTVAIDLR